MNTIKGLNAVIKYFAWGAIVGALMRIGALIFGLLRVLPGGGSFALGGVGLVVSFASLREVRRGRRLKAKLLQTGATEERSGPRNGHMDGVNAMIDFYTRGIVFAALPLPEVLFWAYCA